MVRSALASDALELARRHPHHKELYVAAPIGERVVEGYVDLLVETPGGLVVIDYETDTVASEAEVDAKLDHYELQGAAYAVALEATTGARVAECRFVFCRPRGAIERSVDDLDAARQRVRAQLGG
jgi:ATP-dependent helicase/nuclease subunit A